MIVYAVFVQPNTSHLIDIISTTCSGNVDIAVGHHADLDMLFYVSTSSVAEDSKGSAKWTALDEIIRGTNSSTVSASKLSDIGEMRSLLADGASDAGDKLMPACKDSNPSQFPSFWQNLRTVLDMPNASSCEEVSIGCARQNVHLIRMLCPVTCRCFFPQPSSSVSKGCPHLKCQDNRATAGYYDKSVSCVDQNETSLKRNVYWLSFWNSFSASSALMGTVDVDIVDFALRSGCAVIGKYKLHQELCAEFPNHHSLGTYCPESCDCANNDYWGCPSHCYDA
eukprot:TRINITY_DN56995_c0_g1_i1.p2 TRINITY_DN56995_c0_g1~~TRINITY_DN56995_c0_g1_i1.p2  ORF type:complete len:281 (-),score=10.38 TRINITY_DN56995_c0_g1_i1:261-1103(-)